MTIWTSEALADHHELTRFASGQEGIDAWLRDEATRAQRTGTARTTVWTDGEGPRVVAFHAIAPTQFARRDLPQRSLAAGYTVVPGYLIARLALDRTLQGRGLGTDLLLDALERIVLAAASAGGRLIAVDAIDDRAAAFYRSHDFVPIAGSRRLVMKVATARAALSR